MSTLDNQIKRSGLKVSSYKASSSGDLLSFRMIFLLIMKYISLIIKHISGLSIYLSVEAYKDWQNNPTITTLHNANYPIGKIEYPAGVNKPFPLKQHFKFIIVCLLFLFLCIFSCLFYKIVHATLIMKS